MAGIGERLGSWLRKPAAEVSWRYRVARERGAVGRLNDTLEQQLLAQVPEPALRALQVALDELLTNVIMHAEQAAGPIEIEIAHHRGVMTTTIGYIADFFDPTEWHSMPHGMTVAASPVGGLGIHLVRSLMDDFRHEYADGRNVLTLRKKC